MITPDAIVSDIIETLSDPTEYVRQIIRNFVGDQFDRAKAVVRIGVSGQGINPHYKIEYQMAENIEVMGIRIEKLTGAKIYHGKSHKEISNFANEDTKEHSWSNRAMSYGELETLLGELRKKRRER